MDMIEKAKKLAKYTEGLVAGPGWGVDDQDTLEWLIDEVERQRGEIETAKQTINDYNSIVDTAVNAYHGVKPPAHKYPFAEKIYDMKSEFDRRNMPKAG